MGQFCSCTRIQKNIPYPNKNVMPIDKRLTQIDHDYFNKQFPSNGQCLNINENQNFIIPSLRNDSTKLNSNDKINSRDSVLNSCADENIEKVYDNRFSTCSKFTNSSNAGSVEYITNNDNFIFNEENFSDLQITNEVEMFYRQQSEKITDLLQRVLDLLIDDLDQYYLQLYLFKTRSTSNDRLDMINSLDNVTSRDLLWDILTGQENEDFELFCDILSNDMYNKSIVELLVALECVVALVSSYPHHSLLSCDHRINIPHVEPSSFTIELINDSNACNVNFGSSATLKGNSSTLSLSSTLFNENSDPFSLSNTKKSLPKLSITFKRFCFCQLEQKSRMAQMLNEFSCVLGLSFLTCYLDDSSLKILLDGIKKPNNFINKLYFQSCELNDQCTEIIKEIVEKKTLRSLSFVCLTFSAASLQNLLLNLYKNKYLVELDMCFSNITDEGCQALGGILRFCALKTLKLKNTGISSEGCYHISQSIVKNAYLIHLDMSSNNLGNDGAHHLSTALIHNRTLRELNLENCGINHIGMIYLSRLLKANGSLKELTLSSNLFGNDGITVLSEGLCYNHSLRVLQLDNCNIETSGFLQILKALKHNRSLSVVKLCHNMIGKDDEHDLESVIFLIREVLHLNSNLKLFLRGNYINTT